MRARQPPPGDPRPVAERRAAHAQRRRPVGHDRRLQRRNLQSPILRHNLELEGARYRSGSDTETLLKLYHRDGEYAALAAQRICAFALWDRDERRLLLAATAWAGNRCTTTPTTA
ncbi:MAG: hypothetical protein U0703_01960 [Anaerolineae bacterium]